MFTIDVPPVYLLDARLDVDRIDIMQGRSLTFNLTMENLGNVPVTPSLSKSGPVAEHVSIPDQAVLEIDSQRSIRITISIPGDLPPSTYILTIGINYSHGCKDLVLPVSVLEREAAIHDDQGTTERRSNQPWFWMLLAIIIIIAISLVLCIVIFLGRKKDDPEKERPEIVAEIEHVPLVNGNLIRFPDNRSPIMGHNNPFPPPMVPNMTAGRYVPGIIAPGTDFTSTSGGVPVPEMRFSRIMMPQVPARKPIREIKALPMVASAPASQQDPTPVHTIKPAPGVIGNAAVKSNSDNTRKIISKPLVPKAIAQPPISPKELAINELPQPRKAQQPPPPPLPEPPSD